MKSSVSTSALVAVLVLGASVPFDARGSEAQCVQAVPIVASDDPAEIERQCAMNRRILDNCTTVTGANLMNEDFARNILQQMVQAECDRQAAEWQSKNGACAKAYGDFQRKMEVYSADLAKYQADAQAYTAATGQPPPAPASAGGGISFSMSWCAGNCPKVPVQPTAPASPSCELPTQSPCDTEAIQSRIMLKAEEQARASLAESMAVRRHALEYDCQAAKLIAEDTRRRRVADDALQSTMKAREKAIQGERQAFDAEHASRDRIRLASDGADGRVARVEREIGPLAPPAAPTAVAMDPQARRPSRIHYGVQREATAPPSGAASAHQQRCRQQAELIADLTKTEAELVRLMERLRQENATAQLNEAAKRLAGVRSARERLEAASSDCHAS
jgi:hypothetical protein